MESKQKPALVGFCLILSKKCALIISDIWHSKEVAIIRFFFATPETKCGSLATSRVHVPKTGESDMSEDRKVSFDQGVMVVTALTKKGGWTTADLTLLGQANQDQLAAVLEYLRGQARIESTVPRWYREGDRIIIPFGRERRSGADLYHQEPRRFGRHNHNQLRHLVPQAKAIKGQGEFVLVKTDDAKGYENTLAVLLEQNPDLMQVATNAFLHFTQEDLRSFNCDRIVMAHPPFTPFRSLIEDQKFVFVWELDEEDGRSMTLYLEALDPQSWYEQLNRWGVERTAYLFQRKAS